MTVAIQSAHGPGLTRSLLAAADWVAAGREEFNRITIFPVPVRDTGTTLSLTLRPIADAFRVLGEASRAVTRTVAGASLGVRGDPGMMLARRLPGSPEVIADQAPAPGRTIAEGFRNGAERAEESLDDRRPGTILARPREAAKATSRAAAPVEVAAEPDRQYRREVMATGEPSPAANEVRVQTRTLGGPVIVPLAADGLMIHVHPDTPEAVFTFARHKERFESARVGDIGVSTAHSNHVGVGVWAVFWPVENAAPAKGEAA